MPMIEPQTVPRVKVDFMNDDHHEAVDLLNQIEAALSDADQEKISHTLDKFLQHNQDHFAREEEQMRAVGFPPYACHKGEHERVIEELSGVILRWHELADAEALQHYLQDTLVPWFINHVSTMDSVTAHYIDSQRA
ncbi:bacteriohemerythrin [Neptuniibacter halophilus]|uniref:bacteriohemerythrin n=1 Tax=Neptuniibacter halophilus TaxID=651666 RepID=UPI0025730F68|nr:hemerythrin family protein [Neptuniibacter halophilus]